MEYRLFGVIVLILTLHLAVLSCNGQTERPTPSSSPSSAIRIPVGTAPGSAEIADFNNDGRPDIVVANEQSNNITILLGDGKGKFAQSNGSPFPAGERPNDITIGDFNGDKKIDLGLANHETSYLTILLGDGQGGFKASRGSPVTVQSKPHPHGIASGDFNEDGRLDLVTDSWENDKVEVIFGNGKGGFVGSHLMLATGDHPYQRGRTGDVNNDKKPDILITNLRAASVTVLLGDGRGGFREAQGSPFPSSDFPIFLALGDLNKDGNVDIAVANSPSNSNGGTGRDGLTILFGNGNGRFTRMAGSPVSTGNAPTRLTIGDINGDGNPDIAVANLNSNSITLFLLNGKGEIVSNSTIGVGNQPKGIAIGDLNGDGRGDLVIANNRDNDITLILSS